MLVYANHLSFRGAGAEAAIFKAIGGWLKEQLGFGLHPDQMRKDGEFRGSRGDVPSWLRIYATDEEDPALYAWVLRTPDAEIQGRHWVSELGLKKYDESLEMSCVTKTDERSILAGSKPVMASRPRVIAYVVNNVQQARDAELAASVSGVTIKSVGQDRASYRGLLDEIERRERDHPIILVTPNWDGEYLFNVADLQEKLVGIGQIVQASRDFNSYEMAEVIGKERSAWSGAVNILYPPLPTGLIRTRLFLSEVIEKWGSTQHDRISHILAWVTNATNISRLRRHVRPEGVIQLSLRRRMQAARARSDQMDARQLREALEDASKQAAKQEKYFNELVDENSQLEAQVADLNTQLEDAKDDLAKKEFDIQGLKDNLSRAGVANQGTSVASEEVLSLLCRTEPPSPIECLAVIKNIYGDKVTVLDSATESAQEMTRFTKGHELLDLLKRLVTDYRDKLLESGDSEAHKVFGKNEYAAHESETVKGNKGMSRKRTFLYDGQQVEMFRHVKISVRDDVAKTIRVHFHWDANREKIVIGYCGKHLPVSRR